MNQHPIDLHLALSQHGPMLSRVARALVRDEHYAQDLVQETWARAAAAPPRPRPTGNPEDPDGVRGWLVTTLRNVARSGLRRSQVRSHDSQRTKREMRPGELEASSAAETAERLEAMGKVHAALTALEEPLRSTLRLRFDEGLSSSEIGARMGVAASTVRSRLHTGLERLKVHLDRDFGGDDQGRRAWCTALVPIAGLGAEGALPMASKAAFGIKGLAALFLACGGGIGFVAIMSKGGAPVTSGDAVTNLAEPGRRAERRSLQAAPLAPEPGRRVVGLTPEAPSKAVSQVAPSPMGPHLVVVNPDGVPQPDFPLGFGNHAPNGRGNTSPEAGPRTDASGRLPLFQENGMERVARFVFANAPLVPLTSLELTDEALEAARVEPLVLEVPYTASVEVELRDGDGDPWTEAARVIVRTPRGSAPSESGAGASWIEFQGARARFPHVGTGRPWELSADQLGEWKTQSHQLPALAPGEQREHTFHIAEQRIILVAELVDSRGAPLPGIRVMGRANTMWSHTHETTASGGLRLPLVAAAAGSEVDLLATDERGGSWVFEGTFRLPSEVESGEVLGGKIVMTPSVLVGGTIRTETGEPIAHQSVHIVEQSSDGRWRRTDRSSMAGKDGRFSTRRKDEDGSLPLAFYQFDPISTSAGRYLIESPIQFVRGATNVDVVLTRAVQLKGSVVIPDGMRAKDLTVELISKGCPTRSIRGLGRSGHFESWVPQGTYDLEVRAEGQAEPVAEVFGVTLSEAKGAPHLLQGIRVR